jgi:hypothetical protein
LDNNLAKKKTLFEAHSLKFQHLVSPEFRYKRYASEFVKTNKRIAVKPIKQAVISPSMMMLL